MDKHCDCAHADVHICCQNAMCMATRAISCTGHPAHVVWYAVCVDLMPCAVSLHMQVKEMFGSGTACVVCPVEKILYLDEVLAPYCTVLYCTYCRPLHCLDHWCVVCAFVCTVCVGCARREHT